MLRPYSPIALSSSLFSLSIFRYFLGYEVVKKALTPAGSSPSDLNLGAVIFAGGMAGVTMWSIAIPPDVSHNSMRYVSPNLTATGMNR